jgi:membrane peptidoglycan carboxypeptidase
VQTLNRPVAGKTGTNGVDDGRGGNVVNSAWFVGYTKQISTAVMYVVGNSGTGSLDDYRRPGDSTFFGGTYPAETWAAYMKVATDGQPVKQFDPPAYVNSDSAPQTYSSPSYSSPSATDSPAQAPSQTPSSPASASSSTSPSSSSSPRSTASPRGRGGTGRG